MKKWLKQLIPMTAAALVLLLAGAGCALISRHADGEKARISALTGQAEQTLERLRTARKTASVPAPGRGAAYGTPSSLTAYPLREIPAAEETEAMTEERPDHQLIFVGDSRTVGMARAEREKDDPCLYIGESGEGFEWFQETGAAEMEKAIRACPDAPVVLNLGVNDLENIDNYIRFYRELAEKWPRTQFYYLSVNPVTEETESISQEDIVSFNRQLRAVFPDSYLDCFSYMVKTRFESVDGLHYSEEQYRLIHDFALRAVTRRRSSAPGVSSPEEGM